MAWLETARTIGSGGDHADHNAWDSYIGSTHSKNLVADDKYHKGTLISNYSTSVSQTMTGYTSDKGRHLFLTTDDRHTFQRETSRVITLSGNISSSFMLDLAGAYHVIDGLALTGDVYDCEGAIRVDGQGNWLNGNFIYDINNSDNIAAIDLQSSKHYLLTNNVIADVYQRGTSGSFKKCYGVWDRSSSFSNSYVQNTFINIRSDHAGASSTCYGFFVLDNANKYLANNIVMDTSGAGGTVFDYSYGASPSNVNEEGNIASDTSGSTGGDSKTSSSQFVNVTTGSENLNLKSGADALDFGTGPESYITAGHASDTIKPAIPALDAQNDSAVFRGGTTCDSGAHQFSAPESSLVNMTFADEGNDLDSGQSGTRILLRVPLHPAPNGKLLLSVGYEHSSSLTPTVKILLGSGNITASEIDHQDVGGATINSAWWFEINSVDLPTDGRAVVVECTMTTDPTSRLMVSAHFLHNAEQTTPSSAKTTGTSTSSVSQAITTDEADELLLDCNDVGEGSVTFTPGTGQTQIFEDAPSGASVTVSVEYGGTAGSKTQTQTFNGSKNQNSYVVLAVASAPTFVFNRHQLQGGKLALSGGKLQ